MSDRRVPEFDDENVARFFRSMNKIREEGTPLPNHKCKTDDCGGDVAREVLGCSGGMFLYRTATCRKCGRLYPYAGESAPTFGEKEFIEMMNTPFTI